MSSTGHPLHARRRRTSKEYAGWLGAAAIVPVRVANLAIMATPAVSANQKYAGKIANENVDPTWEQWANVALKGADARRRIGE